MSGYPIFLRDGAKTGYPELPGLVNYACEIGLVEGPARASFVPTLAGVNLFLRFARDEGLRAVSALSGEGITANLLDLEVTFSAINGVERWSEAEKARFRQQSMIGGVVRVSSNLTRPRGLRSPIRGGIQVDLENKDFPLAYLGKLLAQAKSLRNKALWALLAGGGLRLHEGLLIRLSDFDAETGEIWVFDPDRRRFGHKVEDRDQVRFKGRTMSKVFLYEPLRTVFWEALRDYLRARTENSLVSFRRG
ncbi:hypothetical protein [Microvirga massiliensis]|uniref:hypothetical protein n=1 Tax=Microvirga massiliensis TaxID=1033741 RepID=UPI00062BE6EC|nr:hypothetical protein [Microvirga massiliensis]